MRRLEMNLLVNALSAKIGHSLILAKYNQELPDKARSAHSQRSMEKAGCLERVLPRRNYHPIRRRQFAARKGMARLDSYGRETKFYSKAR
jgi:hypothetical protein